MSGTTTTTLAEFLLARIAEDEADAETAAGLKGGSPFARDDYGRLLVDPARVLADCEAKRRIVERESAWLRTRPGVPVHTVSNRYLDGTGGPCVEIDGRALDPEASRAFLDEWYEPAPPSTTLRDLASIYADHPDYREEWRP